MRIIAATSHAPSSLGDLIAAPYLGALSLFAGAALRRDISLEEAADLLDAEEGTFGGAHFDTLAWLLEVRAFSSPALTLVMPEPGRIAGLVGGPQAVMAALAGGQALTVGDGVHASHQLTIASPRYEGATTLDLVRTNVPGTSTHVAGSEAAHARERLYRALSGSHERLREYDMIPEEPVRPDALPKGWALIEPPRGMPATHAHAARLAGRVVSLAEAGITQATASGEPSAQRALEELRFLAREGRAVLAQTLSYASPRSTAL
ncbi:hypothetical protein [Dermabacter vaginalis]|uniref:Uncharacterized protein n=1 Tax=Dermabacter vaginalis TaxID=1630135 RepID=A0ABX6A714_9MICO|nr:hypothetical protein [Dermabacter vaginalis]QEU11930.1 hypothetical protein FOB48_06205 [Dermabacter vaginalis]